MKITVRTNETCPVCKKKFDSEKFICLEHKTRPTRFLVDVHHNNKRKKIYCDFQGNPLSSLEMTKKFLKTLKPEHLDLKAGKTKSEFLFQNYIEYYLKERAKKLNATSMTVKRNLCRFHLGKLFRDTDIRYLTRIEAQEVFNSLPERRSKVNLQDQFTAIINFAVSKGHRTESFKLDKVTFQAKEKASWTEQEIEKILKHVHPLKRPICEFIATYGCRVSEAKGLLWDCVNFEKKEITIRRAKSRSGLMETTKTKTVRVLPMTEKIKMILFGLQLQKNLPKPLDYVFQTKGQSKEFDRGLSKDWKKACKASHVLIGDLRFLRHSFTLNKLKQGWTLEQIGAFTGDTIGILEKHYGKLKATDLKEKFEGKAESLQKVSKLIDIESKTINIFNHLDKKDVNGIHGQPFWRADTCKEVLPP